MTTTTSKQRGIIKGYRSGLEEQISRQIESAGHIVKYETDKLKYIWPERPATYTPDFQLPKENGGYFYVETKGRFVVEDRQKMLLVREQNPNLDIRFVFSNCNQKLYKGSPTSYADWCNKHHFVFANKRIPEEWLLEGDKNGEQKPE
jgi:hypothetical protein